MADFSVDILSDGSGMYAFDPEPLPVPPGSLVSWSNKTGVTLQIEAPAQPGVAAFQTTETFAGLSTTPEYYISKDAAPGTNYPYSVTGSSAVGTIVVVAVQDIPEI
jgi:plastocyanin